MHPLYSPLGVLAKWSDSMSRQIVNMVPSNWGLILICVMFAFFANETRRTAWENGATPQKMSAAQFLTLPPHNDNHRFVSVTGRLYPQYSLPYEGSDSGTLVLMVDPQSKRGFWVDTPSTSTDGIVEISGLSWGMSSDLRDDVRTASDKLQQRLGLDIDSDLKLNADQTPGSGVLPLLAEIGLGTIALLFAVMSIGRNIVFQRQKIAQIPTAVALDKDRAALPAQAAPVQAANKFLLSGKMRLHAKCARRFLAMPAEFARLNDGTLALVTLTDASTYSDGGVSKSRAGLWLCVPKMEGLRIDNGRQFAGTRGRPALRLRYADTLQKGRKASLILIFDSRQARDLARENLLAETAVGGAFS